MLKTTEIDKIKGIVAVPMAKNWYDNKANKILPNDTEEIIEKKKLYARIVADKKPYFFIYIYPQLRNKYRKFIDDVNKKCLIQFKCTLETLLNKNYRTEEEKDFIEWYYKFVPAEIHDCTMNRLCRIVEKEFDGYVSNVKKTKDFDYSIMKSNCNYDKALYQNIKKFYEDYLLQLKKFTVDANKQRLNKDEINLKRIEFIENYKRKCESICSNKYELCDIMLDICYKTEKSKKFVWDICGDVIIENLLNKNDNCFSYYKHDDSGNIEFSGERYIKLKERIKG